MPRRPASGPATPPRAARTSPARKSDLVGRKFPAATQEATSVGGKTPIPASAALPSRDHPRLWQIATRFLAPPGHGLSHARARPSKSASGGCRARNLRLQRFGICGHGLLCDAGGRGAVSSQRLGNRRDSVRKVEYPTGWCRPRVRGGDCDRGPETALRVRRSLHLQPRRDDLRKHEDHRRTLRRSGDHRSRLRLAQGRLDPPHRGEHRLSMPRLAPAANRCARGSSDAVQDLQDRRRPRGFRIAPVYESGVIGSHA